MNNWACPVPASQAYSVAQRFAEPGKMIFPVEDKKIEWDMSDFNSIQTLFISPSQQKQADEATFLLIQFVQSHFILSKSLIGTARSSDEFLSVL